MDRLLFHLSWYDVSSAFCAKTQSKQVFALTFSTNITLFALNEYAIWSALKEKKNVCHCQNFRFNMFLCSVGTYGSAVIIMAAVTNHWASLLTIDSVSHAMSYWHNLNIDPHRLNWTEMALWLHQFLLCAQTAWIDAVHLKSPQALLALGFIRPLILLTAITELT